MLTTMTDGIAWLVVGLFVCGVVLEWFDRATARFVLAAAWVVFAAFWAVLVPHYAFELHSFIEASGSVLAVPASLYAAFLTYSGRDTLSNLSRAVAVMGVIYLPFAAIHPLREFLVELVSTQLHLTLAALGYHPTFTVAAANGFKSAFVFTDATGHTYSTYLVLACTGVGSMSVVSGLITATDAPLRRRARTLVVVIPAIWILNLVRNAFIAIGFGEQRFQIFVGPVMAVVGYSDPHLVSYFIADRVIAQSLSVVALLLLVWFAARELPELLTTVDEVLSVFTNRRFDLRGALGDAE